MLFLQEKMKQAMLSFRGWQMKDFLEINLQAATWSRIVINYFKESLLDHIYVTDPTVCISIKTIKPCFGDHLLIIMELMLIKPHVEMTLKKRLEKVFERCIIQTVQYKGAFT